jgi:hypothetical protein
MIPSRSQALDRSLVAVGDRPTRSASSTVGNAAVLLQEAEELAVEGVEHGRHRNRYQKSDLGNSAADGPKHRLETRSLCG